MGWVTSRQPWAPGQQGYAKEIPEQLWMLFLSLLSPLHHTHAIRQVGAFPVQIPEGLVDSPVCQSACSLSNTHFLSARAISRFTFKVGSSDHSSVSSP